MSGPHLDVGSINDLARAILIMEQAGAIGTAHLMRALASGRIAMWSLLPDGGASKFKAWIRMTRHRPAVLLIGDDDGFDRGPEGWPQAHRAIAWARHIILHAAGAELFHYEAAIMAAELSFRSLIVECTTASLDAWVTVVQAATHQPSVLTIYPKEGVHPIPVRREGLH